MSGREERAVTELAKRLGERGIGDFELAIVLGSGLGEMVVEEARLGDIRLERASRVRCSDFEGMPVGGVPGHAGWLVLGSVGGVRVLFQQGRVHVYEGRSAAQVARSVRAYAELGCRGLVLTNAAGGLDAKRRVPSLMRIRDHVNLQGRSPFARHEAGRGSPYDAELGQALERAAGEAGIELSSGVYAGLLGPSYESPAEIRFLASSGIDAVGMSTVCEALAGHAAGMRVCALSCITNHAAGIGPSPLRHEDVVAAGARMAADFARLLASAVPELVAALARDRRAP